MKIISFWGGPGVGKSTAALELTALMKKRGLRAEYAHEYAKDMTYEKRFNILTDQIYILAKQNRIFSRHQGHGVDYLVSDCALPLGLLYTPPEYFASYEPLVMEVFNSYDSHNVLIKRNPDFTYDPVGRNQDETGAHQLDDECEVLMRRLGIPRQHLMAGDDVAHLVLKDALSGTPIGRY